jgi:hypothetical protein
MRRMTMTETEDGSPEGSTVRTYLDGESYDLPDELADAFERNGWAGPEGEAPKAAKASKAPKAASGDGKDGGGV